MRAKVSSSLWGSMYSEKWGSMYSMYSEMSSSQWGSMYSMVSRCRARSGARCTRRCRNCGSRYLDVVGPAAGNEGRCRALAGGSCRLGSFGSRSLQLSSALWSLLLQVLPMHVAGGGPSIRLSTGTYLQVSPGQKMYT
eukprot:1192325-Prorocentrum_minimum.AAC.2